MPCSVAVAEDTDFEEVLDWPTSSAKNGVTVSYDFVPCSSAKKGVTGSTAGLLALKLEDTGDRSEGKNGVTESYFEVGLGFDTEALFFEKVAELGELAF